MFHCCNSLPAEDLEAFAPTDTEKGWPEYMRVNCILVSMYIIVQRSSWAASFRPVRRILAHYCTQSVNKWQKAIKIDKLCFIYNICRILGWVYIYEVWECRCVTSGMWLVERTPLHFFDKVIYSYPALYSDILSSVYISPRIGPTRKCGFSWSSLRLNTANYMTKGKGENLFNLHSGPFFRD